MKHSNDNYYVDLGTGERVYTFDGAWVPYIARGLLLLLSVTVIVL
jgi:hypothetical protein